MCFHFGPNCIIYVHCQVVMDYYGLKLLSYESEFWLGPSPTFDTDRNAADLQIRCCNFILVTAMVIVYLNYPKRKS